MALLDVVTYHLSWQILLLFAEIFALCLVCLLCLSVFCAL
jgi:hypothetical protein